MNRPWTAAEQAVLEQAPTLAALRRALPDRPKATLYCRWRRRHGPTLLHSRPRGPETPEERAVIHTLAWVMEAAIHARRRVDWGAVLDTLREVEL